MSQNDFQRLQMEESNNQIGKKNIFKLQIQGKVITSIEEKPINCMRKWFDNSEITIKNIIINIKKTSRTVTN